MTIDVEGFKEGDLVWFVDQILWPAIVKKKYPKTAQIKEKEWVEEYTIPQPAHPIHSKIHQRYIDYCQTRFEYEVLKLPIPTLDFEGKPSRVEDYELLPFYYSTKPVPTDDIKYNCALIQAIQISSTWAVPTFSITREEQLVDLEHIPPPIQNPIHIGCPSVSGVYLHGAVVQHMMEPRLIERIRNETTIIDLTKELLNQGISHWKHTSKSVNFHQPIMKKKLPRIPFPTLQEYEKCRIGSQVIRKGDYILTNDDKVVCVTRIGMLKGLVCVYSDKQQFALSQIKYRFDPCFEMTRYSILDQTDWNGNTIVPQLYPNMK
jgi:hypothetical protein